MDSRLFRIGKLDTSRLKLGFHCFFIKLDIVTSNETGSDLNLSTLSHQSLLPIRADAGLFSGESPTRASKLDRPSTSVGNSARLWHLE